MMPSFISQRALQEETERPCKAHSRKAFMLSRITVELIWNMLMSVPMPVPVPFAWNHPIRLYTAAGRDRRWHEAQACT